jgi:hypothetical protein
MSPHFWKWANSTPWESQNTVNITFPADGVTLNFFVEQEGELGHLFIYIALKHALILIGSDALMIRPK